MDTDTYRTMEPVMTVMTVTEHTIANDQDIQKHEESIKASDALPSPAADPVSTPNDDIKSPSVKESSQSSRTVSPSPSVIGNKTNMTRDQLKYCTAVIRELKKNRDSAQFQAPVDYVKLNIPDYPTYIKHPMDFSTIQRKLSSFQYEVVEDFIADVRLVFTNCYKYNGPEAKVSMLCQNVESAFEKSLRQMPPSKESTPPPSNSPTLPTNKAKKLNPKKKAVTTAPSPPPSAHLADADGRPKREIHAPSKDYPETMTRRLPQKNDVQMRFCVQALRELKKSKYRDINFPFLVPVDFETLNIPDYPTIVKHPMDMSTVEQKLNDGDYATPKEFEADVRQIFSNCYLYNPSVTPVHQMGKELEKVFDDKWKDLPQKPARLQKTKGYGGESEEDEQDEKIAQLERHIATISQQIASIKSKKKGPRSPSKADQAESQERGRAGRKRPAARRKTDELPEFSFEQKKNLSERINNLSGDRLTTVVEIIQSCMPNLDGQGEEEIVLDIDALDRGTLHRLHEFVTGKSLVPQRGNKRRRTHHTEADAKKKIQELEKTLRKFGGNPSNHVAANDSSSESDSESSSGGSDSDDSGSSSD